MSGERGGQRTLPVSGAGPEASPSRAERRRWSDPRASSPSDPEGAVREILDEVLDPELPVSVVELGLIYGIEVEGSRARIRITFTATACPCMDFIRSDIRDRLLREPWLEAVETIDVWDPPWTRERITPEGRKKLGAIGVSTG